MFVVVFAILGMVVLVVGVLRKAVLVTVVTVGRLDSSRGIIFNLGVIWQPLFTDLRAKNMSCKVGFTALLAHTVVFIS